MAELTVKTNSSRVIRVIQTKTEIFLRAENTVRDECVQAKLTPEQAVQIAHALLNVAEGKEADADRIVESVESLLEQRVSTLEDKVEAEAARSTATAAQVAAHIASIYSGATVNVAVEEPEQKFYLKLADQDESYVNWATDCSEGEILIDDSTQNNDYQTQFTQAEIDSNPELKKFEDFKIPVPADELAE